MLKRQSCDQLRFVLQWPDWFTLQTKNTWVFQKCDVVKIDNLVLQLELCPWDQIGEVLLDSLAYWNPTQFTFHHNRLFSPLSLIETYLIF